MLMRIERWVISSRMRWLRVRARRWAVTAVHRSVQLSTCTTLSRQLGSAIVAGGKVMTLSERDTTLTGSTIVAGGDAKMIAGGDLTITASKDTATHHEQSLGGEQSQHISSSYDESVNGSRISAGGGVTLAAGQNGNGNLSVLGSNVTADQGGVALIASQAADLQLSHGGARPYPLVAGSRWQAIPSAT